jgi:hypothetical protein
LQSIPSVKKVVVVVVVVVMVIPELVFFFVGPSPSQAQALSHLIQLLEDLPH